MTANLAVPIALLASVFFGLGLVLTQYGLRHVGSTTGATISVPTTTVLCWLAAPWLLDSGGWDLRAVALFAGVGLIYPGVVTLLTFEGSRRMGPTITGTVGSTAPFFAIIAAVLFLGERPTLLAAVAVAAIIAGVALLTWQPRDTPRSWPRRALWLPIGGAMLRGIAQAVLKLGLLAWPNPFAAGVIGYTLSSAVVTTSVRLREGPSRPALNRKGVAWFMLVGVVNGAATFSLYAALNQGNVSVVAPLVATYPLFTLLLGALLLHNERLDLPRLTGVAFTVAGVVLLLLR
ncbi:MAG TPA: DMT family transporter [Alphaproteobacteria bacterium]